MISTADAMFLCVRLPSVLFTDCRASFVLTAECPLLFQSNIMLLSSEALKSNQEAMKNT